MCDITAWNICKEINRITSHSDEQLYKNIKPMDKCLEIGVGLSSQ